MKISTLTEILCGVFVILGLAGSAHSQNDAKNVRDETSANERYLQAGANPKPTYKHCLSIKEEWEQRDRENDAWFSELSTEELTRFSALAIACAVTIAHTENKPSSAVGLMTSYDAEFSHTIILRAVALIREHKLMREFLLKSSE